MFLTSRPSLMSSSRLTILPTVTIYRSRQHRVVHLTSNTQLCRFVIIRYQSQACNLHTCVRFKSGPSKVAIGLVAFLLIRDIPGSDMWPEAGHPKLSSGFTQSYRKMTGSVFRIKVGRVLYFTDYAKGCTTDGVEKDSASHWSSCSIRRGRLSQR